MRKRGLSIHHRTRSYSAIHQIHPFSAACVRYPDASMHVNPVPSIRTLGTPAVSLSNHSYSELPPLTYPGTWRSKGKKRERRQVYYYHLKGFVTFSYTENCSVRGHYQARWRHKRAFFSRQYWAVLSKRQKVISRDAIPFKFLANCGLWDLCIHRYSEALEIRNVKSEKKSEIKVGNSATAKT